MPNKKHNQAVRHFAVKNDTQELVELGQFLRETYPKIKVEREWFILFMPNGKFLKVQQKQPSYDERISVQPLVKYRNPDLMIFEKLKNNKRGKLLCCLEVDGKIHDIHVCDTINRNNQYMDADIDLIVINKAQMQRSIFDEAYSAISVILDRLKLT